MARLETPQDLLEQIWRLQERLDEGSLSPDIARIMVKNHSNANVAHANSIRAAQTAHRIGAGPDSSVGRLANGLKKAG